MLEALARVARGFIVGRDKRQMPEMAHDNLRALFQTLPANRSNTPKRCHFGNDPWTLWDGFQTLPSRSRSRLTRGWRTLGAVAGA